MPRFETILHSMIEADVLAFYLYCGRKPAVLMRDGHKVDLETKIIDESILSAFLSWAFPDDSDVNLSRYQALPFSFSEHAFRVEIHGKGLTLELTPTSKA